MWITDGNGNYSISNNIIDDSELIIYDIVEGRYNIENNMVYNGDFSLWSVYNDVWLKDNTFKGKLKISGDGNEVIIPEDNSFPEEFEYYTDGTNKTMELLEKNKQKVSDTNVSKTVQKESDDAR